MNSEAPAWLSSETANPVASSWLKVPNIRTLRAGGTCRSGFRKRPTEEARRSALRHLLRQLGNCLHLRVSKCGGGRHNKGCLPKERRAQICRSRGTQKGTGAQCDLATPIQDLGNASGAIVSRRVSNSDTKSPDSGLGTPSLHLRLSETPFTKLISGFTSPSGSSAWRVKTTASARGVCCPEAEAELHSILPYHSVHLGACMFGQRFLLQLSSRLPKTSKPACAHVK